MANINRVIIAGNLTRDPQVRFLASEQAVANFGLAINRKFKGSDGSMKEETTFVDVEAWGRQGELVGQYLTKGSGCLVEGRLKLDSWEDKEGKKQSKLRVVAENVQFLGTRPRQGGAPGDGPAGDEPAGEASPAQSPARPARPAPSSAPADDEPPF